LRAIPSKPIRLANFGETCHVTVNLEGAGAASPLMNNEAIILTGTSRRSIMAFSGSRNVASPTDSGAMFFVNYADMWRIKIDRIGEHFPGNSTEVVLNVRLRWGRRVSG
jgi:hypothetical protein